MYNCLELNVKVAYQGNVKFERQKISEQGGVGVVASKHIYKEGMKLVKVEGSGFVYCADEGKGILLANLYHESISLNASNVLALSKNLEYKNSKVRSGGRISFCRVS